MKLGKIEGFSESEKLTYILRVKKGSQKSALNISVTSQRAGNISKQVLLK